MNGLEASQAERAVRVAGTLARLYPEGTRTALHWKDPLELLVATILASRCTDERVNDVAPVLFRAFPDARSMAGADVGAIERIIRPTGFFRNKARAVKACCEALVERHGGEVPRTMEELVALPGVGRKTANVVLTNCFGVPGMVVDTHVLRLARRLGLTSSKDADKVEADLCALLPRDSWSDFCHRLTWHGRRVCKAKRPRCDECDLAPECPKIGL